MNETEFMENEYEIELFRVHSDYDQIVLDGINNNECEDTIIAELMEEDKYLGDYEARIIFDLCMVDLKDEGCSYCGSDNLDQDITCEDRPGDGVGEDIVTGHRCRVCGTEERY